MSVIDIAKVNLSHNRYQLAIKGNDIPMDVEYFSGDEAISEIYSYHVTFTCQEHDLQPLNLLRKNTTLTFLSPLNTDISTLTQLPFTKRIHGVITDFQRLSGSKDEARYQLIIQPRFSLLRHQIRTHRFFINLSIPDVIKKILEEHGLENWEYEFTLKHEYPKREQINQINESDLQFIERLLSEIGIFYTFQLHEETQTEVIHFGDRQSQYQFEKQLPLNSPSGMDDSGVESVWGLSLRHQVVEHSVITKDYNPRLSQDTLLSAVSDMTRGEGDESNYGEVYHYRARHLTRGDKLTPEAETANFWARLDHERFLSQQTQLKGKSSASDLSPLLVLNIKDNQQPSTLPLIFQSSILLTRLHFAGGRDKALQVSFDAVPYSETLCWRPKLKPRPVIAGTLMARVSSAKDNDIYAHQNEDGYYWVCFDADRDSGEKKIGYESMPVRLAKPYAGDTYGIHFPLIQGTEVAIAFHEGDPDRPYIAHALHDSRHPDHITDKNNTRNIIRTPTNNKLRMEDKRGEEHIKLSTEYGGKTQLNLGHLVNSGREKRGDGFGLRTDSWGAIRAGKGLFISTDLRAKASSEQLDIREAQQQLEDALRLVSSLKEAAEIAKAELADLAAQQKLLSQSIDEMKQAAMVLSSPMGIALTSPKTVQLSSNENITMSAQRQTDISVGKKITLAAGEVISLFAQRMGIKAFAAQGKVELQAQGDEMHLSSLKDMTVTSHAGKTIIAAKEELLLTCGGAFIRLKGGQIEYGSPGNQTVKASNWIVDGPDRMDINYPHFPQSIPKQSLRFQLSSSPLSPTKTRAFEPYTLYANGALLTKGLTDKNGNIFIEHEITTEKYRIELIDGECFDINIVNDGEEREQDEIAKQGFRTMAPSSEMLNKQYAGSAHQNIFHQLLNELRSGKSKK